MMTSLVFGISKEKKWICLILPKTAPWWCRLFNWSEFQIFPEGWDIKWQPASTNLQCSLFQEENIGDLGKSYQQQATLNQSTLHAHVAICINLPPPKFNIVRYPKYPQMMVLIKCVSFQIWCDLVYLSQISIFHASHQKQKHVETEPHPLRKPNSLLRITSASSRLKLVKLVVWRLLMLGMSISKPGTFPLKSHPKM